MFYNKINFIFRFFFLIQRLPKKRNQVSKGITGIGVICHVLKWCINLKKKKEKFPFGPLMNTDQKQTLLAGKCLPAPERHRNDGFCLVRANIEILTPDTASVLVHVEYY